MTVPGPRPVLCWLPRLWSPVCSSCVSWPPPTPACPQPPAHLLADPEPHVGRAAAANLLLPLDLISSFLSDSDLAEGAAANLRLLARRLHELLDLSAPVAAR